MITGFAMYLKTDLRVMRRLVMYFSHLHFLDVVVLLIVDFVLICYHLFCSSNAYSTKYKPQYTFVDYSKCLSVTVTYYVYKKYHYCCRYLISLVIEANQCEESKEELNLSRFACQV